MPTRVQAVALVALCLLFGISACRQENEPVTPTIPGSMILRAIQSCDLPATASVVAFVSINQNRFILTPSDDGESASLTLELTTGDRVLLEIEYTTGGTAFTIATAQAVVPPSGAVVFQESDFVLVDANSNSIPDCSELASGGELTESAYSLFLNGNRRQIIARFDSPEQGRFAKGITLSDGGVKLRSAVHAGSDNHAICAADVNADIDWYWQLPSRFINPGASVYAAVLNFTIKVDRSDIASRHPVVIIADADGNQLKHQTSYLPDIDWTHYSVTLAAAENWIFNDTGKSATEKQFLEVLSNSAKLLLLGDLVIGSGNGSCLDSVKMTLPQESALFIAPVIRQAQPPVDLQ